MRRSRIGSQLRRISMEESRRPLGPTAYAHGMSACLENARALVDDSLFLLESGRNARAVALAVLALEDGDKLKRVFRLAFASDPVWTKREWAAFRDHKAKLPSALSLLTHGGFSLHDIPPRKIIPVLWDNPDLPRLAQRLKERCLYVSRLRDGIWSVPSNVAPPELAPAIVASALFVFTVTSTLVLCTDLLVGGQLEESPGFERPDFTGALPRARRWLKWRLGPGGQRWGRREMARLEAWGDQAVPRSQSLANAPALRLTHRRRRGAPK